jgi:hypothetical protein
MNFCPAVSETTMALKVFGKGIIFLPPGFDIPHKKRLHNHWAGCQEKDDFGEEDFAVVSMCDGDFGNLASKLPKLINYY